MLEKTSKYCPYCDEPRDKDEYGKGKVFVWRKVPLFQDNTAKQPVEAVVIYCAYCGRTISVIPSHLFFQD